MNDAPKWRGTQLGDLAKLHKGVSYKGDHLDQPGPHLLGLGTIVPGGGLKLNEARSYAGPINDNQYILPGELLIALTDITQDGRVPGSPGRLPSSAMGPKRFAVTHHVARVEIMRPNIVDTRYLYYALQAPEARNFMRGMATGTTVRAVSPSDAETYEFLLPPLTEQHAIAEFLGALDDKIEANRRVVDLCDALWQTVTAEVFDDIEDGQVAFGDHQPLSSIATFVNGKAFTKNATGTGRMVVRIAELNSGPGASTIYNEIEVPAEHTAAPGDLLFAWSGSLTVQRWYRPEAIINQHIVKVVPRSKIPMWCVHAHLLRLLPAFRRIAAGKATTMGHIQRHDLDVEVGVPNGDMLARLDSVCAPLWHRALRAEMETLILSRLRETLLPQLVRGELQVRGDDIAALMEVSS
jgi:type I restriction enzyme S subunit